MEVGEKQFGILQSTLLSVSEKLVSACLELDPGTRYRLAELQGKVVRLDALLPDGVIYLYLAEPGIELWSTFELEPDASLAGGPLNLLALLTGRLGLDQLEHEGIELQGDIGLVAELVSIFSALDIDLEGGVARFTGDVLAHEFGKSVRSAEAWFKSTLLEVRRLNNEYLREELSVAAEKENMQSLYQNVEAFAKVGDDLLGGLNKLTQRK